LLLLELVMVFVFSVLEGVDRGNSNNKYIQQLYMTCVHSDFSNQACRYFVQNARSHFRYKPYERLLGVAKA
jgi:hypothetical protein